MSIPAIWRSQQTSSTNGTGTLALNAAPANRIGFSASLGAVSQSVHYSVSVAGTNQFEIGIGVFNGGSPGTLTRATVLASSNAGSLVSFSGTIDVILAAVPGQRPRATFTGGGAEVLADLGNLLTFTGSATATRTLPAVATVPLGAGYLYRNAGTAGAALVIDPTGAETIDGVASIALLPGEACEVFATAAGWESTGLQSRPIVRRQTASASATLDFVLPAGFSEFEVRWINLRPATDGAILALRTSTDSGATFAATASDYEYTSEVTTPGTSAVSSALGASATAILLTSQIDTGLAGNSCQGQATLFVGDGTRRPNVLSSAGHYHNGLAARVMHRTVGERANGTAINAIRFLMDSGNITAGVFTLYAVR
jgi:hypothetical protein